MEGKRIVDEIREELFALQDTAYRDFQSGLIPGLESGSMIGVRTLSSGRDAALYQRVAGLRQDLCAAVWNRDADGTFSG